MSAPKRRLKRLVLSNIDLVSAPANPEAWVALMKSKPVPVLKLDADKRRVWGWASVALDKSGGEVVDSEGDVLDVAGLEEASVQFMLDSRATGVNHTGKPPVGRVFEAVFMSEEKARAMGLPPGPVTTGLWIGVQVDDEKTWQLAKAGRLPAFSVEGVADTEPVGKSADQDPARAEHFRQAIAAMRQSGESVGDHRARLRSEAAQKMSEIQRRINERGYETNG